MTIPYGAAREITYKHAEAIRDSEKLLNNIPDRAGAEYIIAQTDGTMIPLPDTEDKGGDKKVSDGGKIRKGTRKEARVTLTHPSGSITPYFGCGLDGVNDTGARLCDSFRYGI